MTATFGVFQNEAGKYVAHALDFDLVSVAPTKEQAVDKLRLAVKTYIEYGLSNNWAADMMFPAPIEFWTRLLTDSPIGLLDPIMIEDNRVTVFEAMLAYEALRPAVQT